MCTVAWLTLPPSSSGGTKGNPPTVADTVDPGGASCWARVLTADSTNAGGDVGTQKDCGDDPEGKQAAGHERIVVDWRPAYGARMADAWVCPECGIDYGTLHPPFAGSTRSRASPGVTPKRSNRVATRTTKRSFAHAPAPEVWSAMEYTAHVADLMEAFTTVVRRMYAEDNPDLSDAFRDENEQATTDKYNEQDKAAVLAHLPDGVDRLVDAAGDVDANGWTRMASFGWGDHDLLTMLQNSVHEGVHHLQDIEKGLAEFLAA